MGSRVTVVVPTHNPLPARLGSVLNAISAQTGLDFEAEVIVVDNASQNSAEIRSVCTATRSCVHVVSEPRLGLTFARLAGISAAQGDVIIFVDDDNILRSDYVSVAARFLDLNPGVGAVGGKSHPAFEEPPEPWISEFRHCLALRDLGNEVLVSERIDGGAVSYPPFAPIGAGMAVRRSIATIYAALIEGKGTDAIADRQGNRLSSGGDCEIVLTALEDGWAVAYHPELELEHVIPRVRTTREYLAAVNRDSSQSWVALLSQHGICPWTPITRVGYVLRILKAWFMTRAWRGPAERVRWEGQRGLLRGRLALSATAGRKSLA